jgi:hypothetical protein
MKLGASFTPDALSVMGKAFDGVIADLDIGPEDETRRRAIAHYIIDRAGENCDTDAARLREQAVIALRGLSNGGGVWWSV